MSDVPASLRLVSLPALAADGNVDVMETWTLSTAQRKPSKNSMLQSTGLKISRWTVSAVAVALIGLLETLQLWVPGRHARFEDFVVDALSACVGFALSAAADWMMAQFGEDPDAVRRERPQ